jgi:hypothetical protein
VADTGTTAFTAHNVFGAVTATGTVREQVGTYSLNPGGLTFLYQFTVATGNIGNLSGSLFDSFTTTVLQQASGPLPGVPTRGASSVTRSGSGDVVSFSFASEVSGETSFALLVSTNAPSFMPGNIALQDGGNTNIQGFAPASLVPEFGSAALMGLCLVGFGGMAGFRKLRKPVTA